VAVEKWTLFPRDKDDPDSPLIPRCVGHYNVFNVADTDGAWPIDDVVTPLPVSELTQAADRLIASSRCEVREDNTGGAFYSPRLDLIHMPCRDRFADAEYFVRILLHEMTHSTAPAVGRIVEAGGFGSEGYAREELVAELGAMFAMNATGIRAALDERDPYWEQHAAYLQSWTRMLTDKPNALYQAASAAERACEYIVGRYNEQTVQATKEAA
jgi:antirestriction protein ArdC